MKSSNTNEDKIEALESDYLYKKISQIDNAGLGLFTAIDIFKDEIIAVFKGKILNDQQAKTLAIAGNDQYFINLLDGTIMDSMHSNCFAKYANDAEGFNNSKFKNNTIITVDENDKVCIKAIKKIKANDELFCSYGKRYWKKILKSNLN